MAPTRLRPFVRKPHKICGLPAWIQECTLILLLCASTLLLCPWFPKTLERQAALRKLLFSTKFDAKIPIIAIMGKASVGKSRFITTLGGRYYTSSESGSKEFPVYKARVHGAPVYLMDTPGFYDSERGNASIRSNTEVLGMAAEEVVELGMYPRLLDGIIYLQDIGQNTTLGLGEMSFSYFERLVGKALGSIILVTTNWTPTLKQFPQKKSDDLARFVLLREYWQPLIDVGSFLDIYDGSKTSARDIIGTLRQRNKERLLTFPIPELRWKSTIAQEMVGNEQDFREAMANMSEAAQIFDDAGERWSVAQYLGSVKEKVSTQIADGLDRWRRRGSLPGAASTEMPDQPIEKSFISDAVPNISPYEDGRLGFPDLDEFDEANWAWYLSQKERIEFSRASKSLT